MRRSTHAPHALLFGALALSLAGCGVLEAVDSGPKIMGQAGQGDTTPPPPGLATTLEYPPGVGGYRRFPFEGASDPLSRDLTRILEHERRTYESAEARAQALDEVAAAKARVAQDAPAAVALIAETMGRLADDDVDGLVDLIGLVEVVRHDPTAVALLQDLLMTQGPLPPAQISGASCAAIGRSGAGSCDSSNPFRKVFERALRSLDETARQGDDGARAAILGAAASTNTEVRRMAVRSHYGLSHSRRLAQSQLRQVLDPDEQYLLNRY